MVTERGYHQKISLDFTSLEDEFELLIDDPADADATSEVLNVINYVFAV